MGNYDRTSGDPEVVTALLQRAGKECHLISPATTCPSLPEGFEVATQVVLVDVANETYAYGEAYGKRCLGKTALDRIAAAAGISWSSTRTDDRRHPYYCEFVAYGQYRQFDNTSVQISGGKTLDLRDGSLEAAALKPGDLGQKRRRITALCETMARLRAVRSLGIRAAYAPDELARPFCVARIVFTGRTSDPELRRAFALMGAQAALGAARTLYGPPPMLPVAPTPMAFDDEPDELEVAAPPPTALPARPMPAMAPAEAPGPAAVAPAGPAPTGGPRTGLTVPGGPERGRPLEEASDGTLQYWARRLRESIDRGASRSPDRDLALVEAMDRILAFRKQAATIRGDQW